MPWQGRRKANAGDFQVSVALPLLRDNSHKSDITRFSGPFKYHASRSADSDAD